MAQDILVRTLGMKVALHGLHGAFKLCPYCGGAHGIVADGKPPHIAALHCNQCARHLSWLSRDQLVGLAAAPGAEHD